MEATSSYERFCKNLERVEALCSLYEERRRVSSGDKPTDVLRAAVVFLHASQEDYLRSVLAELLPRAGSKEALGKIALAGEEGRAEKFTLGMLSKFSGETVDAVVQMSVKQHLDKTSFNSYSDIVAWMERADISLTDYGKQSQLENLVKRRHKIVHEVDLVNGDRKATASIDLRTVNSWKDAVHELVSLIDGQVVSKGIV